MVLWEYRVKALFYIGKERSMGKDLKGKELGQGLTQRKNGKFSARITVNGKRREKYFEKISEARKWLRNVAYEAEHGKVVFCSSMTVEEWFQYWIENIKEGTVRYNTVRNYRERYKYNIKEEIGTFKLSEVKPLHCQSILNVMYDKKYAYGTMQQTRITMYNMFQSALENDLLLSNPVRKSVKCKYRETKERRVLTIEEQEKFLEYAKETLHYEEFALILQTGMRVSEVMGLKWSDIDFAKRSISIQRILHFRKKEERFEFGEPKSKSGIREIPMTDECYRILKEVKMKKLVSVEFPDLVFTNKLGIPTKSSTYDSAIAKITCKAGIEKFSMHCLRHTFATRCIECGMRPKTLQKILGHANISITMNLYVHVTDEEKYKEMQKLNKIVKTA